MKKQISPKIISLCFGVLVILFLAVFYISAWTEPGQTPPGGNVLAPIHTGEGGQIKSGGLSVGSLSVIGGLSVGPEGGDYGIISSDGYIVFKLGGAINGINRIFAGASSLKMDDNYPLRFGFFDNARADLAWYTGTRGRLAFSAILGATTTTGYIVLAESGHETKDNRIPPVSNYPALRIYTAGSANANHYLDLYHDGTKAVINSGTQKIVTNGSFVANQLQGQHFCEDGTQGMTKTIVISGGSEEPFETNGEINGEINGETPPPPSAEEQHTLYFKNGLLVDYSGPAAD